MQVGIGLIILVFLIYVFVAAPPSRIMYAITLVVGIMVAFAPIGQSIRNAVVGGVEGADKGTSQFVQVPRP